MTTRTVCIFGSATGIGAATADYFRQQQWTVIAIDKRFKQKPVITGRYQQYYCDVTDRLQLQALAQTLTESKQLPDRIIKCVGVGILGRLESVPFEQVDTIIQTNIVSTISLLQIFLPLLRAVQHGRFIQISSIAGKLTYPLSSLYHASKFAIEGLLESLQFELTNEHVSVHLVRMAGIATPFQDTIQEFHNGTDTEINALDKLRKRFAAHICKTVNSGDVAARIYQLATADTPAFSVTVDRLGRYLLNQRSRLTESQWHSSVTINFSNEK